MSDFSDALNAKLSKNDQLAQRRRAAEEEMARVEREKQAAEEAAAEGRREQHATLSAHLKEVADQLKASRPESFIVRTGWTESGEEFIAKMSTRQKTPKRSLFIEVDRDDDEVLARWTSEIGNAIEIWRLGEVSTEDLTQLVLQLADDQAWMGRKPPAFPGR